MKSDVYPTKDANPFISNNKNTLSARIFRDRYLFILFLPGLIYYIVFKYLPMFGIVMAFQDYDIFDGFFKSKFVGLKNFEHFFNSPDCLIIIKNTIVLNLYLLLAGFPIPILFALFLNELRYESFKRLVQTISYLPHFISTVVVAGMVIDFLSPRAGIVNVVISGIFGTDPIMYMAKPEYFRGIYIITDIWRGMGWNTIIFIAAISGIDPTMYEAAIVDGANRFKRIVYITLPCLIPTIIILLILKVGYILDVGFEMVFLLQNNLNFPTSEIISTYVYRKGILGDVYGVNYSYAAAVNLFQNIIGFIMILLANRISRKVSDISLW